ncbi:hypothetical protein ROZALSC1DRAFT_26153, partial [Rozella allomycis CSF55]
MKAAFIISNEILDIFYNIFRRLIWSYRNTKSYTNSKPKLNHMSHVLAAVKSFYAQDAGREKWSRLLKIMGMQNHQNENEFIVRSMVGVVILLLIVKRRLKKNHRQKEAIKFQYSAAISADRDNKKPAFRKTEINEQDDVEMNNVEMNNVEMNTVEN